MRPGKYNRPGGRKARRAKRTPCTPVPPAPRPARGAGRGEKDSTLDEEKIRLGQFLKLAGLVATGGEAKRLIQGGGVLVNGEVETRRKRQLRPGDEVAVGKETFVVVAEEDSDLPPRREQAK